MMLKPLVAVVVGLVGTVDGDVEVLRLHLGELGELHIQLREVSAGDLLVDVAVDEVAAEVLSEVRGA